MAIIFQSIGGTVFFQNSRGYKPYNKALLSDKFSAALQICRRARHYPTQMYLAGAFKSRS